MTGTSPELDACFNEVDENSKAIVQAGKAMARAAVDASAGESGRTVDEQWKRMGDRFAYEAAEQNPNQVQLDDL